MSKKDKVYKVIIEGGRYFNATTARTAWLTQKLIQLSPSEIVIGGAAGADRMAEIVAKEKGLKIIQYDGE